MTPLQMAVAECARNQAGVCLGRAGRAKCRMATGERCAYFEETVLPLASLATDKYRAKQFRAAAEAYRRQHDREGV